MTSDDKKLYTTFWQDEIAELREENERLVNALKDALDHVAVIANTEDCDYAPQLCDHITYPCLVGIGIEAHNTLSRALYDTKKGDAHRPPPDAPGSEHGNESEPGISNVPDPGALSDDMPYPPGHELDGCAAPIDDDDNYPRPRGAVGPEETGNV